MLQLLGGCSCSNHKVCEANPVPCCWATLQSGRVQSTRKATTGMSKSVRFLPIITPFAVVRGAPDWGTCVPPPVSPRGRTTASTPSDFALPKTINPLSSFLFHSRRPATPRVVGKELARLTALSKFPDFARVQKLPSSNPAFPQTKSPVFTPFPALFDSRG
jgi:hypothetical protein